MEETKTKENKTEKAKPAEAGLIAVVRIHGMVKVKSEIANTLDRLRLRRKYACVLIDPKDKIAMGMLNKVKYFIAYGNINNKMLTELIKERAMSTEKEKIDPEKITKALLEGKKLTDLKLKPFFRLHPPRKGIKSKLQFPKGALGNHKDKINDLIVRML